MTMTADERMSVAREGLERWLGDREDIASENKLEQSLSDLRYAVEHLETMLKNLPDPLTGDDMQVLVLELGDLEDLAEAVQGVRTDFDTLAQVWDNRPEQWVA